MTLVSERPAASSDAPAPGSRAASRGDTGAPGDPRLPWLIGAWAGALDADERAAFQAALPAIDRSSGPANRFLIATCQRVEWYGHGPTPERDRLLAAWPRLAILEGDAAVDHALRLAAGLDSAIVGEDQVLHQVRAALRDARSGGPMTPELGRLVEIAIRVGRRARSRGNEGRATRSIATLALGRLGLGSGRGSGSTPPRRVLVVGAGAMGELVARAAASRGLAVVVASRSAAHARAIAAAVGRTDSPAESLDLRTAALCATTFDAIVVALGGPWEIDPERARDLPPVVDLSAPAALPLSARAALGARWTGIDALLRDAREPRGGRSADGVRQDGSFTARAEGLVEAAAGDYRRWLHGRASIPELRRIADRAERLRAADVDALLRRLDGLEPRQRALIERFSEQLVARLLHEPLARLGSDPDGSAAEASRRIFGS
jgi:glutamyl-tRNA reductase